MKILIISHEYPPIGGGGANACFFLSKQFAKWGHQVTIVTAQYENLPQKELTDWNVLIYRVKCRRNSKEKSNFFEMFTYLISAWQFTNKLLNTETFDKCLVFFGIPSGPIALHLKHKFHLPYIVRFGGGDIPGAQKRYKYVYMILSSFIRSVWKNADSLIANSEGLYKRAQLFEDKYEITIVENGVDTNFFVPKEKNSKEQKEIKILFVSRLIEGKGLQFIIPDMPKVKKEVWQKCHKEIKLLIVGDGPYKSELEKLTLKAKTCDYISFEGHKNKEQIKRYYQDSDIFILPSLSEGMPNVVLEAMACGLPIIITPCEGSKELVTNNGIVTTLDKFAENLIKLCIDEKSRQIMGQHSLSNINANFKWENIGEKYMAILEKTTNNIKI